MYRSRTTSVLPSSVKRVAAAALGQLHSEWFFYVSQRDRPEDWKCQPKKWLPPELEKDEIKMGCISLLAVNTVTSIVACHIANGGWSMVYYSVSQYSWLWYFAQWPVIFCYQLLSLALLFTRTTTASWTTLGLISKPLGGNLGDPTPYSMTTITNTFMSILVSTATTGTYSTLHFADQTVFTKRIYFTERVSHCQKLQEKRLSTKLRSD